MFEYIESALVECEAELERAESGEPFGDAACFVLNRRSLPSLHADRDEQQDRSGPQDDPGDREASGQVAHGRPAQVQVAQQRVQDAAHLELDAVQEPLRGPKVRQVHRDGAHVLVQLGESHKRRQVLHNQSDRRPSGQDGRRAQPPAVRRHRSEWRARASLGQRAQRPQADQRPVHQHRAHPAAHLALARQRRDWQWKKFRYTSLIFDRIHQIALPLVAVYICHSCCVSFVTAYILPILETCVRLKNLVAESSLKRTHRQPIALVLVPTRELVRQVHSVISKLTANVKSATRGVRGAGDECASPFIQTLHGLNVVCDAQREHNNDDTTTTNRTHDQQTGEGIDILVTTPGQLQRRMQNESTRINSVYMRHVVVDEADTLLDDSFSELTLKCLRELNLNLELSRRRPEADELAATSELKAVFETNRLKEPSTQLVLVSATVPRDMNTILRGTIDAQHELRRISTSGSNRLLLVTPQRFFRMSTPRRLAHLLDTLRQELGDGPSDAESAAKTKKATPRRGSIMIFANDTNAAVYVSKALGENGIECDLLVQGRYNRDAIVRRFFGNGDDDKDKRTPRILVCTDIASRGWDTTHVAHVINYEMPRFVADYLHRVGRVGRLGSVPGGLVTSYVTRAFEAPLVQNIERSVRLDIELENVDANAKRFYKRAYEQDSNNNNDNNSSFNQRDNTNYF